MKRRLNSRGYFWSKIIVVLAVLFIFFGSLAFNALNNWTVYLHSENWNKIDAKILKANIVKRENFTSLKGSSYEASFMLVAKYKYFYEGKEHYGTNLFIGEDDCFLLEKQREFLGKLKKNISAKIPRRIYVNPSNPSETFIFRIVTPGMLIGLFSRILILYAISMLSVFIAITVIKIKKESKLAEQYPSQEWLINESWNKFIIKEKSETIILFGVVLTTFLGLFCPLLFSVMYSTKTITFIVPVLLLGVVILTLFAFVAMALIILNYYKYGNAELVLGQLPFDIGNECKCVALLPAKFSNGQPFKTKIACEESRVVKSDEGSSMQDKTVFASEKVVKLDTFKRVGKKLALPITFDIPLDLPSTSSSSDLTFEWKIYISAEVTGLDFSCDFAIPVYKVQNKNLIKYKS